MIRRRLGRALDVAAAVLVTVGLLRWSDPDDDRTDPDGFGEDDGLGELGEDWPW